MKPILLETKHFSCRLTWDPVKAQTNLRKHGVDFTDAATIFLDEIMNKGLAQVEADSAKATPTGTSPETAG